MTDVLPEVDESITCNDCGACCRDVIFALNEEEVTSLRAAGSKIDEILGFLTTLSFLPDGSGNLNETQLSWSDFVDVLEEYAEEKEDTLGRENWKRVIKHAKGMKRGEGLFVMSGACGFLREDGSCGNYKNRPLVCRDFPVGGVSCRKMREKQGISVPVELTTKPV